MRELEEADVFQQQENDGWDVDFSSDEWLDDDWSENEEDFRERDWFLGVTTCPICRAEYKNAAKEAKNFDFSKEGRHLAILNGRFVMGDLIEAIFVENNFYTPELNIATLSFNQNNADSLYNLVNGGFVGKITLIISHAFYSHERHKNGLMPYIYGLFKEHPDKFQVCVVRSHCKVIQFKTDCGKCITMHGSANLRSSDCIEQMMIENDKDTFECFRGFFAEIEEKFSTIDLKRRVEIGG